MDGGVVRLRTVADIVAQNADVAQGQGLAAFAIDPVPGPALQIGLARLGRVQHADIGEVAHQLLPAVHDGVRQVSGVVDVQPGGDQGRVIL